MASNSDISDDQVAQILPQISRLLQTVAAPDAEGKCLLLQPCLWKLLTDQL